MLPSHSLNWEGVFRLQSLPSDQGACSCWHEQVVGQLTSLWEREFGWKRFCTPLGGTLDGSRELGLGVLIRRLIRIGVCSEGHRDGFHGAKLTATIESSNNKSIDLSHKFPSSQSKRWLWFLVFDFDKVKFL